MDYIITSIKDSLSFIKGSLIAYYFIDNSIIKLLFYFKISALYDINKFSYMLFGYTKQV